MTQSSQALSASDIVVFGGTGDLSMRKIVPALYHRMRDGQLPWHSRVVLVGRKPMDGSAFQAMVRGACDQYIPKAEFSEKDYAAFAKSLNYAAIDAAVENGYDALAKVLSAEPRPVRVFYLATPANIFGTICEQLKAKGLITSSSRVVMEKPIGHDLVSFRETNQAVLACFSEEQIYRIDHYLGKETVQNLMVLRFGNHMFERIWNGDEVEHVQITVAEEIGVGERYSYYDSYGALRDMVQNHLLQLLCLVAMEAPAALNATNVRDEKLKVLRSLRPITAERVKQDTVRGQYSGGTLRGKDVASYTQDIGGKASDTESFVAIKAHVDNWRWSGVPFYLRTGKRLSERYSEIVIQFREVPHNLFPSASKVPPANKLVIRLQPDEHIHLQMNNKVPGPGGYRLKPVNLTLSLKDEFSDRTPDAYERLLMDVVRGNQTLFMRSDEVEAAWLWAESVLGAWAQAGMKSDPYTAGSEGPESAAKLIQADGHQWYSKL